MIIDKSRPEVITVDFQISDIANNCMLKISEIYRTITFLYHAIDIYPQETFIPMVTESIPIMVTHPIYGDKVHKPDVYNWVFSKGLTDCIIGIQESLVAACNYFSLIELQKEQMNTPVGHEELLKKIDKFILRNRRLHLPELLKTIERTLSIELLLKEEISSINDVRNCIVHNNGIATERKSGSHSSKLQLYYLDIESYIQRGNQLTKLTAELRQGQIYTGTIELNCAPKSTSFVYGSKILIDVNVINAVCITCYFFASELFKHFPEGNEI